MQIDPHAYGKEIGRNYARIFEPEVNIEIGTIIFKSCLTRFRGNYKKALEAYNAGSRPVVRHRVPKSTVTYANRILEAQKEMAKPITIGR